MSTQEQPKQAVQEYKVVWVDGFARETVADHLVQAHMTYEAATALCAKLCEESKWEGNWWKVVPQEEALWRGMADLIGAPE